MHIFIDEEYAFSCSIDFLIKNDFYKDKEITKNELEKIEANLYFANTKDYLLNIFAKKNYTENEIRQKLYKRHIPENIINKCVKYLKDINLLNETEFISDYINYLKNQEKYSKLEIKKKIFQKHFNISNRIIENLLADYDEENIIKRLIKKKNYKKGEENKLINFFIRKGFPFESVKKIIKINQEDV